jgi:hypothetical protein
VSLVSAGWATWGWWRRRGSELTTDRVRMGIVLATAVLLAPWAWYWGLVV